MKAHLAYAYAGALNIGCSDHFDIEHHFEDARPYGSETVRANLGVEIHADPWPDPEPADAVFSNPPCAPFSSAGYGTGRNGTSWLDDPRLSCHEKTVTLGRAADASVILIESVPLSRRGRPFFEALTPSGWHLTEIPHNAVNHGIPQNRSRIFWIYSADPMPLPPDPLSSAVLTPATFANLDDLGLPPRRMPPQLLERMAEVPQGRKLRKEWDRMGITGVGVPSMNCRRLRWGSPTPTISGTYGYAHPDEDRYLGINELKRVCGYPDDYEFAGGVGPQLLQMVRAVMPPVASWISGHVAKQLA